MKPKRTSSKLLLLLLAMCVLDAGLASLRAPSNMVSVCELDEELEECVEELLEEQPGDASELVGCLMDTVSGVNPRVAFPQQLTGICAYAPSRRSLGWILPLRI